LDEDVLRAADGAVGADALGDPVSGGGARLDLIGALGPRCDATTEDVLAGELPQHGPREERTPGHRPPPDWLDSTVSGLRSLGTRVTNVSRTDANATTPMTV